MRVFVVGAGWYSNWHVIGAFSSLEKAQEFTARVWATSPDYDEEPGRYILELELDAPPEPRQMASDEVRIPGWATHQDPNFERFQKGGR